MKRKNNPTPLPTEHVNLVKASGVPTNETPNNQQNKRKRQARRARQEAGTPGSILFKCAQRQRGRLSESNWGIAEA